jgi:hypothetical protein
MIPNEKKLRKLCKKQKIKSLPESDHFAIAEEFIKLTKEFAPETVIEKVELWIDMIFYPLYLIYQMITGSFSFLSVFSIQKCVQTWIRWFRFRTLKETMQTWLTTVRSVGGPFISSNDPEYHMYVYADGMERIKRALESRYSLKNLVKVPSI